MAKTKLPKRLFKSPDRVSSYQNSPASAGKLMKRMTRDHLDVLQNLEFVFARRHRQQRDIDDRTVVAAIHACLTKAVPEDPIASELVAALDEIRGLRADVSDDLWRDAFLVIEDSVKFHSRLRPGETSYLVFIQQFVR